jgi:hypothetical protein
MPELRRRAAQGPAACGCIRLSRRRSAASRTRRHPPQGPACSAQSAPCAAQKARRVDFNNNIESCPKITRSGIPPPAGCV